MFLISTKFIWFFANTAKVLISLLHSLFNFFIHDILYPLFYLIFRHIYIINIIDSVSAIFADLDNMFLLLLTLKHSRMISHVLNELWLWCSFLNSCKRNTFLPLIFSCSLQKQNWKRQALFCFLFECGGQEFCFPNSPVNISLLRCHSFIQRFMIH